MMDFGRLQTRTDILFERSRALEFEAALLLSRICELETEVEIMMELSQDELSGERRAELEAGLAEIQNTILHNDPVCDCY